MSESNTRTDQARARWAAEYREARKVRRFDEHFMTEGGLSSLWESVSHAAYIVAIHASTVGFPTMFARRNGRYGLGGRTKRMMAGPARRLPA